ncbi:MAG: potassium/proton antiporter [Lentisphaeria bacterium]|nr:potassium/proton antiporter [Lentisphaeria bacterium]
MDMTASFTALVALFALLMMVSLLSSKLSGIINMPCLLLFLAIGLVAGSELLNSPLKRVTLENGAIVANYIGSVAMAFILFSGGFDTSFKNVRPVFGAGTILSSLGVLLTALFSGLFVWSLCGFVFPEKNIPFAWCLLLGSIISSTDAAAVFSILRSKSVSLKGELQPLLELESGSNDPMATLLTLFMIDMMLLPAAAGTSAWREYAMIIPFFLKKMSIGLAVGLVLGKAAVWIYNRIDFDYNGLYYALGIVIVLLTYSLAETAKGNGFMAVYAAGMVMGNSRFVFHNGLGRFYDGVAWIMQAVLFTMLGVLAEPDQVWNAKWIGLGTAVFLMFAARPLAVAVCLIRSRFSFSERVLIGWVGLRGGAPIMLATFPLMKHLTESGFLFHIVFFIVLTSVLLQGMTIMPLAKLLKLAGPLRKTLRVPLTFEETGDANSDFRELPVPENRIGQSLKDVHLPSGVLVLLIRRNDRFIVPRGNTQLESDDILTLMGTPEAIRESEEQLASAPK